MLVRRRILRHANRSLKLVLPRRVHGLLASAVKRAINANPPEATSDPNGSASLIQIEATSPPSRSDPLIQTEATGADQELEQDASAIAVIGGEGEMSPCSEGEIGRDSLAEPIGDLVGCGGDPIPWAAYMDRSAEAEPHEAKLVVCCAFSGRHRTVEKIVAESLLANHNNDVRWMLVGSSPEDFALIEALARRTGRVAGFIVENSPLGRKWQTCFYLASRYYRADLYGICGSDDFISNRLVDHILDRYAANLQHDESGALLPAMYGTLEWLVCDVSSQRPAPQIIRCSYEYNSAFEPLGAGRFYTRQFVEECGGLIFESNKERLLDDRGYFEAVGRGRSMEYYTLTDGALVSVKGSWEQLNTLNDIMHASTLSVNEYSFLGAHLLSQSLSAASFAYLFRTGPLKPQLTFTMQPTGLVPQDQSDARPSANPVEISKGKAQA